MSLLQAPETWVAVAFIAFLGVVHRAGGFAMILGGLDKRGTRVRAQLDEARSLREEAARVLADYQARRVGAEAEAAAIVADARAEADRLARDAEAKLADFVARRTKQAEIRIAQAEAKAAADVRAAAADAAAGAAAIVLRDGLRGAAGEAAVAKALAEVRGRLN